MLSEIFYWVLNAGIIASLAGLAVLGLRRVKGLPRFAVYVLWLLPLLRFWMPFGLANEYSVLSWISKITTKTVAVREVPPQFTFTNSLMLAEDYFPIQYKTALWAQTLHILSLVWIVVCLAAVFTSMLLYFFTRSELKSAELIKDNIYQSDKISVPAVYGIFRPKIILPVSVSSQEYLDYVIRHEKVHVARRDNLFRVIAVITACVHWFNPLSWIFLKYFFIDMELACDAKVLKGLSPSQTKDYARAIVACASGKTFFVSAFGGAKTRVRIENILSYKKLTLASTVFFAALVIFIAILLMTNATL